MKRYSTVPFHDFSLPITFHFVSKICSSCNYRLLKYIFNLNFITSDIPLRWNSAHITRIPKKSPSSSTSNFRPVSFTSALRRAFEKRLKKRKTKEIIWQNVREYLAFSMTSKQVSLLLLLYLCAWTIGLPSVIMIMQFTLCILTLKKLLIKFVMINWPCGCYQWDFINKLSLEWSNFFVIELLWFEWTKVFPGQE